MQMLKVIGDTHVGNKRTNNEDNFAIFPLEEGCLFLVADGVGGRNYGEVASETIVDVMKALVDSGKFKALSQANMTTMMLTMAVQKAHVSIANKAQEIEKYDGMSSTLTMAYINDHKVWVAQVGDSRLYRYHANTLEQLTGDQTVARALVETGRLSEEQVSQHPDRNTLQQSMGLEAVGQPLDIVVTEHEFSKDGFLIACTDGLTDMVEDDQISAILDEKDTADAKLNTLIQTALENGGKDNVTVIVAHNQGAQGTNE